LIEKIANKPKNGEKRLTKSDNDAENSLSEKQQFAISERRRKVASLLAQSRTESEIAQALGVNQSTISRDIQALKQDSSRFLQELAKSDLVFSFQQSIIGIEEVKRKLWDKVNSESELNPKEKLMAFRLIMIAEETKFRLLEKGPILLSYESLEEKVNRLEKEAKDAEIQGESK
jgi:IS30 family transposase